MFVLTRDKRQRFKVEQARRATAQADARLEWLAKRVPAIKAAMDYQATEAEARRALEDLRETHRALLAAQAEYQAEIGKPDFHFRDALRYCEGAIAHLMVGLAQGHYSRRREKPDYGRV